MMVERAGRYASVAGKLQTREAGQRHMSDFLCENVTGETDAKGRRVIMLLPTYTPALRAASGRVITHMPCLLSSHLRSCVT